MTESDLVNERLQQIADFVSGRLQAVAAQQGQPDSAVRYRWQHTLRVCRYGQMLAEAEGAHPEIVLAACLLHDVATFDPGERKDHGRRGAEIARPALQDLGYLPREVETICYAVASHVDVDSPETIEARIVTDADNLDRFGAYRILLWCQENLDDFERLTDQLAARLGRLQDYRQRQVLETPSGNALFHRALDLQIAMFQAIVRERELTRMPRIEPALGETPGEEGSSPVRIRAACV